MSSSQNPVENLLKQFKTLNKQLKTCTNDLKKINEREHTISKIEFQHDEIDSDINSTQTECKETIERLEAGWEEDLSKLQLLENYLQKESKEKDKIEEYNKNSRLLDNTYDDVQKEILEKDSKSFSDKSYGFKKAGDEIEDKISNLYEQYENALDSRLTTNKCNYMKSTADTLYETAKNLIDTLRTSYAFYNYSNKIRP